MAEESSSGLEDFKVSPEDQTEAALYLCATALDTIIHDILLDVHQDEKVARMHTAYVELEDKATKLGRNVAQEQFEDQPAEPREPIETKAAILDTGKAQLTGNPMKTVKHIRCPNCRLRRLLYPRVGFNSRPVPDVTEQYCKEEPMIIVDKHDVHGQRKKGVKVKGQAKGKNKKKNDPPSPASEASEPVTPISSMPDSFEFREIEYPAAKCPNRTSHLGDHWKAVNIFATHLNGACYLQKNRAAGREANAKIAGTPRDSRANSPKAPATNGVKRKAVDEENAPPLKKKKTNDLKKGPKGAVGAPSKLRESSINVDDKIDESPIKSEPNGDSIQVTSKMRDGSNEPPIKLKLTGLNKDKKAGKLGKKADK
ncbi:uncharacterized protein AB675_9374 [Cyphellophora attinorum]|uniref:Uncharacterized protein n=1 Tax=Cyphellophora attinorum TaxID=1664694 RepID=A0A0N1P227_9EURO|nr:uncharacterized protein AB675_9374 [Phialophora attinorum]KPI41654.1 hypothetical protein AB675_9374 [Phialophora attinorum]